MGKFGVTYQCSNPNCQYQDTIVIDAPSRAQAWSSCSVSCPAHELSGNMHAVKVEEMEQRYPRRFDK